MHVSCVLGSHFSEHLLDWNYLRADLSTTSLLHSVHTLLVIVKGHHDKVLRGADKAETPKLAYMWLTTTVSVLAIIVVRGREKVP